VHEAQAQAALASVQAEGALSRRRSDLRAARARYEAASRRAAAFANDLVPASRRLVGMAREAWELGRAPLTTLLQAQTDLTVTQADGTEAALAAWQAVADLEEAAGAEL
jgi:outer membrane protein TolC